MWLPFLDSPGKLSKTINVRPLPRSIKSDLLRKQPGHCFFGCIFNSLGDSNEQPGLGITVWGSSFDLIHRAAHFPRLLVVAAAHLLETGARVEVPREIGC